MQSAWGELHAVDKIHRENDRHQREQKGTYPRLPSPTAYVPSVTTSSSTSPPWVTVTRRGRELPSENR